VTYPASPARPALREALRHVRFAVAGNVWEDFAEKLAKTGAVAEALIEGAGCSSPSVQLRINPRGETTLSSTHEQLLSGASGQVYQGCRFPADERYRAALQEAGLRVGRTPPPRASSAASPSTSSRAPARPAGATSTRWKINLRMGGTTHPMLALRFLTGGALDPASGLFRSPGGSARHYRSTDNLESESYRGLLPEDLVEIITFNRLHYHYGTETGVLFHMIGAISEFGKVGMTAIGGSPAEAEDLFRRAVLVLDRETRYRPGSPAGAPP
jgi:hypothetical protein